MMYDHPSYRPNNGIRYNEPFCASLTTTTSVLTHFRPPDHNLAKTLISEFPCRPHWTKNDRTVLKLVKVHNKLDAGVRSISRLQEK